MKRATPNSIRAARSGLALPAALVVLSLLGLLLAGAQRAAALQWRMAAWLTAGLQTREDARAAAAAALRWLRAGGRELTPVDCTRAATPRRPRVCSDPAPAARPPWAQAWHGGIDGCRGACGFHVQALPALDGADARGERSWLGFRVHAYAAEATPVVLQLDVQLLTAAATAPRLRLLAWRTLR